MMDRTEATGLGVAVTGHLALLALLSLGLATATIPKQSDPIEVSFVEETGLESVAPTPSDTAPAPKLAELEGPVEPVDPPLPAAPPEPAPLPQPKAIEPVPAPKAKPAPRPQPKAAPEAPARAKATPQPKPAQRSTGRLSGLLKGLSDSDSESRSTTQPAKTAGPAVQSSLAAEIRRQLKPHWKSPTGPDVELLRTTVEVRLGRDGSIIGQPTATQTGANESNRSQAGLHKESAIRAVRLAAPFKLPAEYYDAWKVIRPVFDKRLSQ